MLVFVLGLCSGQEYREYVGHYTLKSRIKKDTLVDNELKMKFILDSARINISALDFSGKLIWHTDPWADNKIEEYRVKRPIIVLYSFAKNKWTKEEERIWIRYNNTQFGTVDKLTGKFIWMGQD